MVTTIPVDARDGQVLSNTAIRTMSNAAIPAVPPPGWPIVEPHLLMTFIGNVMIVYQGEHLSEETFERHTKELERAIDLRKPGARVGVLYHLPTGRGANAKQRKRSADLLESRRAILAKSTAGFALVTPSPIVRGLLRAIFWMASPPYPYEIVSTLHEGFAYLASKVEGLDPIASERAYVRLLKEHAGVLAIGAGR
jgi:hypothetical protein